MKVQKVNEFLFERDKNMRRIHGAFEKYKNRKKRR